MSADVMVYVLLCCEDSDQFNGNVTEHYSAVLLPVAQRIKVIADLY